MKYSVIIPVFNNEKHLSRCIDSVINQTYEKWEMVLVNDGSSDNSGALLDGYKQQYPDKVNVLHQQNTGVLFARRVGMALATGQYVLFLDSDDSWEPELLQKINNELTQTPVDIVFFGFCSINELTNASVKYPLVSEKTVVGMEDIPFVYNLIVDKKIASLWVGAYRQTLMDLQTDYSSFKGVFKGEDLLQNVAMIDSASSFLLLPDCYYRYYFNPQGLSESKITHGFLMSHILVQNELMKYFQKWGIPTQRAIQMFKGVFHTSLKRLMTDSLRFPMYSKKEVNDILQFLISSEVSYYLDNLELNFSNILIDPCIWLLQRKWLGMVKMYILYIRYLRAIKRIFEGRHKSVQSF